MNNNNKPMIAVYKITEDDLKTVKRAYYEYITHGNICAEVARSTPEVSLKGTAVYEDYLKCVMDYDVITTRILNEYTKGEYDVSANWRIDFGSSELIIY